MLTPEQQERYSRHLLLDGFDQDAIRAASVHVQGRSAAALWAARYLAASGVGRLVVDEPAWHDELRRLAPWTNLSGRAEKEMIVLFPQAGADAVEAAEKGAMAALQAIREVLAK